MSTFIVVVQLFLGLFVSFVSVMALASFFFAFFVTKRPDKNFSNRMIILFISFFFYYLFFGLSIPGHL